MIMNSGIGTDLGGGGCDCFNELSQHLCRDIKENHDKLAEILTGYLHNTKL